MRALLRKEWNEHRLFLLGLYVAGGAVLGIAWAAARTAITPLGAWGWLLMSFGTLAAALLSDRLVMREYGARTQLFLETLPVGRGRVLAAKWLFGLGALLLFFVPAFGFVLFGARERVYLGGGLPAAMALRSVVFLSFVYAAGFAIALTLRLRVVIWSLLAVVAWLWIGQMGRTLDPYVPYVLVSPDMALEAVPPWRQLALAAGLGASLAIASYLMACAARGALPLALERPLSARTRTALAFLFAGVYGAATLSDNHHPAPPFHMEETVSSQGASAVHIGWLHDVAGMPPAQLAERIAADQEAMRAWLGLEPMAELSIVPDAWRAADEIGFGDADATGHQVIHAALGDPDLSLAELQDTVRVAQIMRRTPILQMRDDRGWLLWGFSIWWGGTA